MRKLTPLCLIACLLPAGCSGYRPPPTEVVDEQDEDIRDPDLWVWRVFSKIEGDRTLPAAPLPGATVRAILGKPATTGPIAVRFQGEEGSLPALTEPSPIPGTIVAAFEIPQDKPAGSYEIRFFSGEESSAWLAFEVTTPALLSERQSISAMARALPQAVRPGMALVVEYHPMPAGTIVESGLTGEVTYGPSRPGDWLVYGFRAKAGLAQDAAFWAVGNPVQGLTVVHDPVGPVGWPFGHREGEVHYAVRDFSNLVTLNNQFFDAAGEGDAGKPLRDEPAPPPPPAPPPAAPPATGHGLTGDLGPCPNGITTVGIVIQLDDNSGFDWLRAQSGKLLSDLGARPVELIDTEEISTGFKYDPDKLASRIRDAVDDLDCECSEVVITVISHGKAERDGSHTLIFKDRYKERRSGKLKAKKTKIDTAGLLALIAKAFHDVGKDCVAVTTLLQPCYSGAVLDEVEEAVRRGAGPNRRQFRVMSASAADQPAYGHWDGETGVPEIYFLEALRDCLRDRSYDFNGDGRVSLQEAWPCLLERVWMRAWSGARKDQNPKKWPNP